MNKTPEVRCAAWAYLDSLCDGGRTPGDRELALAQAISLCGIAEQLERIGDYLERIAHSDDD